MRYFCGASISNGLIQTELPQFQRSKFHQLYSKQKYRKCIIIISLPLRALPNYRNERHCFTLFSCFIPASFSLRGKALKCFLFPLNLMDIFLFVSALLSLFWENHCTVFKCQYVFFYFQSKEGNFIPLY